MTTDVKLELCEKYLKTDAIILHAEKYDETPREDFELYDREQDDSSLMINIHKETGEVLVIILELFRSDTEYTVKMLREYPLPWTFSLPSLGITEKPLDEVLLVFWEKYKDIKMEWE